MVALVLMAGGLLILGISRGEKTGEPAHLPVGLVGGDAAA